MIILGQINFSDLEEERLFGYWKKVNKQKKNQELMNKYGAKDVQQARVKNRLDSRKSVVGSPKTAAPLNINQLINKKSHLLNEDFGANWRLNPYAIKSNNKVRFKDDGLKDYDHSSQQAGYTQKQNVTSEQGYYDKHREENDPKYKERKEKIKREREEQRRVKEEQMRMAKEEKLKESIKGKEEKIKKLKKIKNIKRAGLIGAGVVGTAGLAYGGYKLYKNKKKKED